MIKEYLEENKLDKDTLFPSYCIVIFIYALFNPVWFVALAFLVGLHRIIHPSPLTIGTLIGMIMANYVYSFAGLPFAHGYSWFMVIVALYSLNFMWMLTNPKEFLHTKYNKKKIVKKMKLTRWSK